MGELTDAEALCASRSDPHAFVTVFERHFDTVSRYLRRRVARDLADDLAAETFVRAFEHRARFRPERDDALPWLYGIATNLLRQHFRREVRELRAFARTGIDPAQDAAPVDPADTRVAAVLAKLTDGERDVLFLFAWAELDYDEIAQALGIPGGTVRSRLHRARAKLRELLVPHRRYADESMEADKRG